MAQKFGDRLMHAWNAFTSRSPTNSYSSYGPGSSYRPDRVPRLLYNDKTIATSIYNRIAIDVAAIDIQHVKLDKDGRFSKTMDSGLNRALTLSANIDQSGRAMIQELVLSIFDEGVVAMVPVETNVTPYDTGTYGIETMRIGKILEWYPDNVKVHLYNDATGIFEDIMVAKSFTAIIENPLYAVMNEPNSTMQRLVRKLSLLDSIDEQSSSGKLDIIIQLPYVVKTEAKKALAEERRANLEMQMAGSKYGIAYIDGTERVTQLNRPAANNLMEQITYLTTMLYGQLGLTESVFNGTASEAEMINYHNRTIEPILAAISNEIGRKFISKTARTQGQSIRYFRDPFKLVSVESLADIADKFTRNEILSSNEVRDIIGRKPSKDPNADELRNKNLNQAGEEEIPEDSNKKKEKSDEKKV